jgi:hypothetical protein
MDEREVMGRFNVALVNNSKAYRGLTPGAKIKGWSLLRNRSNDPFSVCHGCQVLDDRG